MSKKRMIRTLKRQSVVKDPTVWIGRNGVTKALLSQIGRQLEAREMIKVKVHTALSEHLGVDEIAGTVANETGSQIVDVRGRTFTVYKKRKAA